jgi:hypothetical protein
MGMSSFTGPNSTQQIHTPKEAYIDPYADMPTRPEYQTLMDSSTGWLTDPYILKSQDITPDLDKRLSNINLDTRGLEALRERALTPGDSAWAKLMLQKQGIEEGTARDAAAKSAGAAQAQARASLAMRGGLTGGARQRIAMTGARNAMDERQNIARQGLTDRLSVRTEDEKQRMNTLTQLPGMEVQALQPEFQKTQLWSNMSQFDNSNKLKANEFNIQQAIGEKRAKDQFEMQKYNANMQTWAANKQGEATEKASSGGCWICTEVNKVARLSDEQKDLFFNLKKHVLKNHRDGGRFYLRDCKELTRRMTEAGVDWHEYIGFEKALSSLLRAGLNEAAYIMYRGVLLDLMIQYWPECDKQAYLALIKEQEIEEQDKDLLTHLL